MRTHALLWSPVTITCSGVHPSDGAEAECKDEDDEDDACCDYEGAPAGVEVDVAFVEGGSACWCGVAAMVVHGVQEVRHFVCFGWGWSCLVRGFLRLEGLGTGVVS